MYHQRNHPARDWTTNTSEISTLVDGLETMTDYIFQIRSYTSVGPGPWSNRLPFRTFPYGLYSVLFGFSEHTCIKNKFKCHYLQKIHCFIFNIFCCRFATYVYSLMLLVALPGPTNLLVRRMSPTAFVASWDPPPIAGIVGYRVYYDMLPTNEMEKWQSIEIASYTLTEISGLEPHSAYAVRVRAKTGDGRYSNFSEPFVTNNIENGSYSYKKFFW